jgi:hydrogenase nickel incorporation protein HypB
LLNKIDLLQFVAFDVERFVEHVRRVNAVAPVLSLSALTGEGIDAWYQWLREGTADADTAAAAAVR